MRIAVELYVLEYELSAFVSHCSEIKRQTYAVRRRMAESTGRCGNVCAYSVVGHQPIRLRQYICRRIKSKLPTLVLVYRRTRIHPALVRRRRVARLSSFLHFYPRFVQHLIVWSAKWHALPFAVESIRIRAWFVRKQRRASAVVWPLVIRVCAVCAFCVAVCAPIARIPAEQKRWKCVRLAPLGSVAAERSVAGGRRARATRIAKRSDEITLSTHNSPSIRALFCIFSSNFSQCQNVRVYGWALRAAAPPEARDARATLNALRLSENIVLR